jgi:hypothetical protein
MPKPNKRLILYPQDKGGIGKSFIATLLHDFLVDAGVAVKAFDLDHANSTFQRFVPDAEFIDTDLDAAAGTPGGDGVLPGVRGGGNG